jgi:hypothetical protein
LNFEFKKSLNLFQENLDLYGNWNFQYGRPG